MIRLVLLSLLSTSLLAQASFQDNFKLERNDEGELTAVKMNTNKPLQVSLKAYFNYLKTILETEKEMLTQRNWQSYRQEQVELLNNKPLYQDALAEIKNFDLDQIFNNEKVISFISSVEGKLNEKLAVLDLTILAKPDNTKYFVTKKRIYQSVNFALNLAQKAFSKGQVLNFVTLMIRNSEAALQATRTFKQNQLLHYLENYSSADLNMTDEEVNAVMSSLMESRRPWYSFWDQEQIDNSWQEYGFKSFYSLFRNGTKKLKLALPDYDSLGERYNFAFSEATLDGANVVLNLQDARYLFDQRPAVAFDYDNPNKIMSTRLLCQLLSIGLNQLTAVPSFIRNIARNFLDSTYKSQRMTEGALAAYFLENDKVALGKRVVKQNLNPYLIQL